MKKTDEVSTNFNFSKGKVAFFKWKNSDNWPVEYVSPSIEHVFGYKTQEFYSGDIIYGDIIHPDDLTNVVDAVAKAVWNKQAEYFVEKYRLKDKSGEYRVVYEHGQIVYDEKGVATHFKGYIIDQTEIITQKQRLEIVLEGGNIGFWDWNVKTNKVVFDDIWVNMIGYDLSEIDSTLETWSSNLHPDDLEDCIKEVEAHLKGQTASYSNVFRMIHKDGSVKYILSRGKIVEYDEDGNPIRFAGTHTDITDIKQTELQLSQKKFELERYVNIIDENIISSTTDLKGRITSISKAFCLTSGYLESELIGGSHNIVRHEDMPKKFFRELWRTIKSDKPWSGEIKNRNKNGDSFWLDATISSLYDIKGNKIGYSLISHNITDKKRIEYLSITDGLTNVYNRRYFNEVFPKILNSAKRRNSLISFLELDVDYFKAYNDTYGHLEGDKVLIKIANLLKKTALRADDYCFRLGGEEFGIIFNVDSKQKAISFANKIKEAIESLNIPHSKSYVSKYITVSIGLVCEESKEFDDINTIYKKVDDLLYKAKERGRNIVCY